MPVFVVDKDFNVIFINDYGAVFVNKQPSECLGQKCSELFKIFPQKNSNPELPLGESVCAWSVKRLEKKELKDPKK